MTNTPTTAIDDREIDPEVAERFRVAFGFDEAPETFGEFADATADSLAEVNGALGVDHLCLAETSRHEARVGDETYHFACVLDALLLPFVLEGDATTVDVRSESPASDAVVAMTVSREGVSADPESAVVSFGIEADPSPPADRADAFEYGYRAFCPYVNAFPDEAAYEEWAAATPDAATTPLRAAKAFALAKALAQRLSDG
ncbi:alkylmercury lyase [Halostella sp. JP-L12]|uniref:organomercurial lyase n=1 Tax=Halostella TaxID=1843185 RepID=UPI000EF75B01|nr:MULTISPECIES: organomercurial lyase [Halostella]NHN46640.1 alkylmercury lyase [Halostella sp. JP-L12]